MSGALDKSRELGYAFFDLVRRVAVVLAEPSSMAGPAALRNSFMAEPMDFASCGNRVAPNSSSTMKRTRTISGRPNPPRNNPNTLHLSPAGSRSIGRPSP